ncbi:NAD(+)/NADH kinase [Megasphaera paucivorans]|uniref:NAD kinase n=1 Tax=Megasphaera paucivorans TaxID=349095 RepID=A0A1G9T0S1_9FIRM|nr:NAD(+)/NADH kinase [Megasphaera paucivorans]SDM41207.1 NAD+ kinase [Megasphaera paucivorans]
MRIGIFPNLVKEESAPLVHELMELCLQYQVDFYLPEDVRNGKQSIFKEIPEAHLKPRGIIFNSIDVAMVLGGDGTILKLSREFAGRGVPICGVNIGSLGFLYEVETESLENRLKDILEGRFFIEERMMLQADLCLEDGSVQIMPEALNDIVVGHGNVGKLIRLDMYINHDFIQQYPCDGIIISTPTGSTGYTFSSGGPIVAPSAPCLMVTPICPHLLLKVPLILSDTDRVSFTAANNRNSIRISVDGMVDLEFTKDMTLHIRKSDRTLKLMRFNKNYFYKNLFTKLMGTK